MQKLFTEQEIAKILKISRSTLRKARMSTASPESGLRDLGYVKMGKSVRYTEKSLEKFIQKHLTKAGR